MSKNPYSNTVTQEHQLVWQIPLESIVLMAEYTTNEGPHVDDTKIGCEGTTKQPEVLMSMVRASTVAGRPFSTHRITIDACEFTRVPRRTCLTLIISHFCSDESRSNEGGNVPGVMG
jgi:hypothetical protein